MLLGAVRKIKDMKIVLNLPNNMNGAVSLTEVSDVLSEVLGTKLNESDQQVTPIHSYTHTHTTKTPK